MLQLWNDKGLFIITEQRLVDQANCIRKRGWISDIELEEIKRKIEFGDSEDANEVNSNDNEEYTPIIPETGERVEENWGNLGKSGENWGNLGKI